MIIPIKTFEEMTRIEQRQHLESLLEDHVFVEDGNEVPPEKFLKKAPLVEILIKQRRRREARTPRPDQETWDAEDLRALPGWPLSRSMTYKLLKEKDAKREIKLIGLRREKIDTTKRYKRGYKRSWISRRDKEKLCRELGLA